MLCAGRNMLDTSVMSTMTVHDTWFDCDCKALVAVAALATADNEVEALVFVG